MFIKLKEKNGKKLKTAGTACAEDINIIPVLQDKKVDGNGTYTADDGYVGIGQIIVEIENEPSIPEGYVKPSGTKKVTTNETHDVKDFEFVEVAVPTENDKEYNIYYDKDKAPTDKTMLWVQSNPLESVHLSMIPEPFGTDASKTKGVALPVVLVGAGSAAIGETIYIFGGYKGSTSLGYSRAIYAFDTVKCAFRVVDETLPVEGFFIAATVDEKVYLFGGKGAADTPILIFDPTTESITTIEQYPRGKYQPQIAVAGKKIYLFGGAFGTVTSTGSVALTDDLSVIQVFDTETNKLSTIGETLPQTRYNGYAINVDGLIYIVGGMVHQAGVKVDDIWVFDPSTEKLTVLKEKFYSYTTRFFAVTLDSKIYMIGGQLGTESATNKVFVFDTKTLTKSVLRNTLDYKVYSHFGCLIGKTVYLFGGYVYDDEQTKNIAQGFVTAFNLEPAIPENHLLIEAGTSTNFVDLTPEARVCVKNLYRGNANGVAKKINGAIYDVEDRKWIELISPVITEYHYTSKVGSSTITVSCSPGDLLVGAFYYSLEYTLPEGWEVLVSEKPFASVTNEVKVVIATKVATSESETFSANVAEGYYAYMGVMTIPGATGIRKLTPVYRDDKTSRQLTVERPAEKNILWIPYADTIGTRYPWTVNIKDMPVISRYGFAFVPDCMDEQSITFDSGYSTSQVCVYPFAIDGIERFYTTAFDED